MDQPFFANWNNKQARGYRAADDNYGYGSIYRSQSLSDRIRKGIRGGAKMTIPELIDAMEGAGTVDLRATKVLPYALRVLGHPRAPRMRQAVATLRAWVRSGGHRLDSDRNGVYEHSAAVPILDRWWPKWMRAQFKPSLGSAPYTRLLSMIAQDDDPNLDGEHHGSAYQTGWYGYAQKDLRRRARPQGARQVLSCLLRRREAAPRARGASAIRACARRSEAGAERRPDRVLQGRDLRQLRQAVRPVVLRRGAPAPGRARSTSR